MGKQARNYTSQTLKKLFALSGNICAFPRCTRLIVNQENAKDSNICHIEGANKDSERYRAEMTDKERADYPNLILLCIQHHDETNDTQRFPVSVLKEMKSNHESSYLQLKLKGNPSMLRNTINALSEIDLDGFEELESLNVIDPEIKINYNSVKRNYALIQEYKVYHHKINSLYDELELQGSIKKEKLLRIVELTYTEVKGNYVMSSADSLEIVRKNSDNIIDDVFNELYIKLEGSGFWDEDIILGLRLIMVDAFMRCKILEEPEKDDNK